MPRVAALGSSRVLAPLALVALLATGAVVMWPQTAPAPAPKPQVAPPQVAPAPKHGPPGGQQRPPPAPGAESSLGDVMNGMRANLKALDGAVTAKDTNAAVAAVGEMERLMLAAKKYEPENVGELPEAERAAHVVAFRKDLLLTLKQLADLEIEVLDGNFEAATARINGPLVDVRDESHDKYRKKKQRH